MHASSWRMLTRCAACARRAALRSASGDSTVARSSSVRSGDVTGIPLWCVTSRQCSERARCTRIPWTVRAFVATTVTSGRRSSHGRYSPSMPAQNQLRYARLPQASTAAIARPSRVTPACPTA